MRAPAVRKAEMIGRESRLHRKPNLATPSTRYSTATRIDTWGMAHMQLLSLLHESMQKC